jgi:hypothetical protein
LPLPGEGTALRGGRTRGWTPRWEVPTQLEESLHRRIVKLVEIIHYRCVLWTKMMKLCGSKLVRVDLRLNEIVVRTESRY